MAKAKQKERAVGDHPPLAGASAGGSMRLPETPRSELIEAAPDAILGVDRDGLIRLANRQAEAIFGYRRSELIGAPIEALIPERLATKHAAHRVSYFSSPRPRAMGAGLELFGKRKDGSEFPVDVSLSAVETEAGLMAAAFVRDITDRKRAEDQLRQANRDLEAFSHTISHDLRAPLRAMRGFGQALAEDYADQLDAKGRDFLSRIVRAGGTAERLIDDLLEYSRLGQRRVETREVSVEAVVLEVLRPLSQEVERTGATVEVERPLLPVMAEPQVLGQAISNLITNALKYVAEGHPPKVRVRTLRRADRVLVCVEDEGIGIAPEHLERIWKPFERLHGGKAYPGTGVGLAIVQRAAERMGGSVGVQSEPGRGSRFWVDLPAPPGAKP